MELATVDNSAARKRLADAVRSLQKRAQTDEEVRENVKRVKDNLDLSSAFQTARTDGGVAFALLVSMGDPTSRAVTTRQGKEKTIINQSLLVCILSVAASLEAKNNGEWGASAQIPLTIREEKKDEFTMQPTAEAMSDVLHQEAIKTPLSASMAPIYVSLQNAQNPKTFRPGQCVILIGMAASLSEEGKTYYSASTIERMNSPSYDSDFMDVLRHNNVLCTSPFRPLQVAQSEVEASKVGLDAKGKPKKGLRTDGQIGFLYFHPDPSEIMAKSLEQGTFGLMERLTLAQTDMMQEVKSIPNSVLKLKCAFRRLIPKTNIPEEEESGSILDFLQDPNKVDRTIFGASLILWQNVVQSMFGTYPLKLWETLGQNLVRAAKMLLIVHPNPGETMRNPAYMGGGIIDFTLNMNVDAGLVDLWKTVTNAGITVSLAAVQKALGVAHPTETFNASICEKFKPAIHVSMTQDALMHPADLLGLVAYAQRVGKFGEDHARLVGVKNAPLPDTFFDEQNFAEWSKMPSSIGDSLLSGKNPPDADIQVYGNALPSYRCQAKELSFFACFSSTALRWMQAKLNNLPTNDCGNPLAHVKIFFNDKTEVPPAEKEDIPVD